MSQITTTNRQAILALIAAADETTEVNSIESRLESLEDFILTDAPSGVATFSASASITNTVTDGTTQSTISTQPTSIVSTSTDNDKYGQISIEKSFISIVASDNADNQTPSVIVRKTFGIGGVPNASEIILNTIDNTGNGGEANLLIKSERDTGSSIDLTAEFVNNTAVNSIISTVADGTGTQSLIDIQTNSISIGSFNDNDGGSINIGIEGCSFTSDKLTSGKRSEIVLDPDKLASADGTIIYSSDSNTGLSSKINIWDDVINFSVDDGVTTTGFNVDIDGIKLKNIPAYDDDAAAGTAGLVADMIYQTTGNAASPLDVAGILMIKQ